MEINQDALFDVIFQLIDSLQWTVEELERVRKVVCSDPELSAKYLAETKTPAGDVSPGSIRALHQRVLAIHQKWRHQ